MTVELETVEQLQLIKTNSIIVREKFTTSEQVANFARQFYKDDLVIYESFFVLFLNASNYITGYVKISQGGMTETTVDIRLIIKYAINYLCISIIIVHNHPSGSIEASEADIRFTKRLRNALKLFQIELLDHIILTEDDYLSFAYNLDF